MDSAKDDDLFFDSDSDADFEGCSVADGEEDRQENYIVLKEEDIRRRQDDDITKVSSVLSVSREAASLLLRHYSWSVNTVHEEWFADEERARKAVGLLDKARVESANANELTCGICFEIYSSDEISGVACGHAYCNACWEGYITTSIDDGSGCLMLKCPDPSCNAAVGPGMIDYLAPDEYKLKYLRYLIRSYVEDNRKIKWCPAPGCDCAVEFDVGSGSYDVTCGCLNEFCWHCTEDAHRPVDCDTVAKWIVKNKAESENTKWMLAYTKPCPKCQRPIEKNHGCMHMTCRPPCKYQFCWLCLKSWKGHGYGACNGYNKSEHGETEKKREMARRHLVKYTHYYERWAANEKSKQKALTDLRDMVNVRLSKLSQIQSQPETELKFILDAWRQIVKCRRVLKWTYAYGYYLPENEQNKRQFFEYLQGQAEAGLERLHQCAEKELENYLKKENPDCDDFKNYRAKLVNLTTVTGNYFENLVRALENGLADVDSGIRNKKRSSNDVAEVESSSKRNASGTTASINR